MKQLCIFAIVFLCAGICSVAAQDFIILRDGHIIEAKVLEIHPTEIRYKRHDNLEGPVVILPKTSVLSIRYENGTYEIVNAAAMPPAPGQENTRINRSQAAAVNTYQTTALDPERLTFAFNINPAGSLMYGPSLCLEFTKRKFNTEINLIFPSLGLINGFGVTGFGGLVMFNYFAHSRIGGAYVGGGLGYIGFSSNNDEYDSEYYGNFTLGLNLGYKFVTKSGVYFRTGGFIGVSFYEHYYSIEKYDGWGSFWDDYSESGTSVYFKPDLTIGYSF